MKIVFLSVKTKKSNIGYWTYATANFKNFTSVRHDTKLRRILYFGFGLVSLFSWYLPNFHQFALPLKVAMASFYEVEIHISFANFLVRERSR